MRQQIMGALRKAGGAIRDADRAYSGKITQMYTSGPERAQAEGRSAHPLQIAAGVAGPLLGGGVPSFERLKIEYQANDSLQRFDPVVSRVLPAMNAIPKYVLPAGGVTLAGKALYDLTAQFGNAADYPEDGQLRL